MQVYMRETPPFISSFVRLGCSSVIECLPSVCQVLGSIPSTVKQESAREYHCGSGMQPSGPVSQGGWFSSLSLLSWNSLMIAAVMHSSSSPGMSRAKRLESPPTHTHTRKHFLEAIPSAGMVTSPCSGKRKEANPDFLAKCPGTLGIS